MYAMLTTNSVHHFLFIRGLSYPCCVQASLSLNCLTLTIPGFPYNCLLVPCGDIGFLKNLRYSIGLEIRPQSTFIAPRMLLPSANYSAEWSYRVWQPSADNNGNLSPFFKIFSAPNSHYCQQRAFTPDPGSSNSKTRAPNCHYYMQRAVTPDWMGSIALWEHITAFFSRAEILSEPINNRCFLINKKGFLKNFINP